MDLWRTLLAVHVILLFLFGLLDCDEISEPVGIYCVTVLVYLVIRFVIAKFKGYPILSRTQAILLALLPVCGPILFTALFYGGQLIRYGR